MKYSRQKSNMVTLSLLHILQIIGARYLQKGRLVELVCSPGVVFVVFWYRLLARALLVYSVSLSLSVLLLHVVGALALCTVRGRGLPAGFSNEILFMFKPDVDFFRTSLSRRVAVFVLVRSNISSIRAIMFLFGFRNNRCCGCLFSIIRCSALAVASCVFKQNVYKII